MLVFFDQHTGFASQKFSLLRHGKSYGERLGGSRKVKVKIWLTDITRDVLDKLKEAGLIPQSGDAGGFILGVRCCTPRRSGQAKCGSLYLKSIVAPRSNRSENNDEVAELEFPQPFEAEDVFRATAARIRVFRAFSLTWSPSRKSMARLALPSRLELKRPEGSSNEAPLANVIFTTFL
jgi:hypothetical protein